MKTKLLNLLLILIVFSSCNTAKNYAKYRFGGKSKLESNTISAEIKSEEISEMIQQKLKADTLSKVIFKKDSSSVEMASCANSEKYVEKTKIKKTENTNSIEKIIDTENKKLPESLQISKRITKKNQADAFPKSAVKSYGFDGADLLYVLGSAAIIAGGVLALLAAGIALGEIIIWALGLILVAYLLYLLGEAFMNIFPGMSKKKNSIKKFLTRIFHTNKKTKSGMKYYGGMTVKEYFWIGIGVIALTFFILMLTSGTYVAWAVAMFLFELHLGITLLTAMCVGIMNMFPGYN